MTLFEKIYWTLLVVNAILAAFSIILDDMSIFENEEILGRMMVPMVVQVVATFGYLVVKLLFWIWGKSFDLFPSCWTL